MGEKRGQKEEDTRERRPRECMAELSGLLGIKCCGREAQELEKFRVGVG